jgi:flagellar FliL protein
MADQASATGIVADESAAPGKPAGRRGLMRIILALLLLLAGVGAGIGAAMFVPGLLPASPTGPAEEAPARPKVVPKASPLEYVEIDNVFTSNLKDSGRFVQVRIAVSTHGGKPVVDMLERHRLAIISVVLGVLAEATEAELSQPGGRDQLTRQMRIAINDLLQRKSGIAGIDDVYLTSFVVQ